MFSKPQHVILCHPQATTAATWVILRRFTRRSWETFRSRTLCSWTISKRWSWCWATTAEMKNYDFLKNSLTVQMAYPKYWRSAFNSILISDSQRNNFWKCQYLQTSWKRTPPIIHLITKLTGRVHMIMNNVAQLYRCQKSSKCSRRKSTWRSDYETAFL